MKFKFKVSKLANLLFFFQKTSQCHLISRNINRLFYEKNENKIWEQIEKSIGIQKVEQIKKSIVALKPAFVSYWPKALKHLLLWERYFQNNQPLFQQVILEVKKLSGTKHFAISKIPIYLVSNPCDEDKEISAWFSWTPKENFIVIEIPIDLKVSNNFFPLSVLAHEIFHSILRKNENLFLKISKIAEENEKILIKLSEDMPNRIFLEELLISSFIPEGYLGEKYFGIKVNAHTLKPKDLLDWRRLVAFKLRDTVKKYLNNTQQIDKKYLQSIIEVVKQSTK
ncbi:MAG: hypothetical protein Q7R53_01555 [bacterium]|nr:hypothetical protein [bacterium]